MQEAQILEDQVVKVEVHTLRVQNLTDNNQEAQASGNLGMKGDVQIWRAQELIGEDQVAQTLEAKVSDREVEILV